MIGEPPAWAVLQHAAHEGPGLIGAALSEAGLTSRVLRPDLGEPLPRAAALAGLVVLGGPMGVHDLGGHPWLIPELTLVVEAVERSLPVLGVGLGAQQLALALGADVVSSPAPEVGLGQVELTDAGRRDPVFGPEYGGLGVTAVPCVHRHVDTFSLPAGSVHLAATRACPNQAFRFGDRAYGLQFHVEIGPGCAAAWAALLPGATIPDADRFRVATVGSRLVNRYFAAAGRPLRTGPTGPADLA